MAKAVTGLVSLPTTHKRRAPPKRVRLESEAAAKAAGGLISDPHTQRVARLRRGVGYAARLHGAVRPGFRGEQVFMVTLTYGVQAGPLAPEGCPGDWLADGQWRANDVRAYLNNLRNWAKRMGFPCRYVWVAELQKRGVVHYHVAIWAPAWVFIPPADRSGWWPHGSTRTERARSAPAYLMKYLSKGGPAGSTRLPTGSRMFGVGGLDRQGTLSRRWLALPSFIKARADIFQQVEWARAKGLGGWWNPDGYCIPSEFQRRAFGPYWGVQRVADYGRPFQADGAFCWLSSRASALAVNRAENG